MYNLNAKADKPLQRVMVKSVLSVADAAGDYPTFHLYQMHVALNINLIRIILKSGLHIFIFVN